MRRTVVQAFDDLDNSQPAAVSAVIGYNGVWYQLDLTEENGELLAAALTPFLAVGEMVGASEEFITSANPVFGTRANRDARAWLKENGHPNISSYGRISKKLWDKYIAYLRGQLSDPVTSQEGRSEIT